MDDQEFADRIVWIVVIVGLILAICALVVCYKVEASGVADVRAIWTGPYEVTVTWMQDSQVWSYLLRKQNTQGGYAAVGRTLCGPGPCEVVDTFNVPERAVYRIIWDFGGLDNVIFGDYTAKHVIYMPVFCKRCLKDCSVPGRRE